MIRRWFSRGVLPVSAASWLGFSLLVGCSANPAPNASSAGSGGTLTNGGAGSSGTPTNQAGTTSPNGGVVASNAGASGGGGGGGPGTTTGGGGTVMGQAGAGESGNGGMSTGPEGGAGGMDETGGVAGTAGTGGTEPIVRPNYATLREAAAAAGLLVGAAVDANVLGEASYVETLDREFDYVTPENATKWGPLAPSSTTFDWSGADAIVSFAEDHDQVTKGHTFIWHEQSPSWVTASMSPTEMREAIQRHIVATMERYRGRMRAWDVVNEAVDVSTATGYRDSVFYQVLGESYIADAFRWAREADPDMLLFYNEIGAERLGAKSDFLYEMIRNLLDQGVPIDGIGFQCHVSTHRYPSENDLRANIRRFADLGLIINLSEADVRTLNVPGDQAARWHAERIAYQQIVGSCAIEPGCEAVTFWGVTDNYSWLNDEATEDPLLFDRSYQKKPSYDGAMDGFAGFLPVRGRNLLRNADFANGADEWAASAGQLSVATAEGRDGNAACVSGRTATGDGLVQLGLLDALSSGGPMAFSAMVRVSTPATVEAALLVEQSGMDAQELNVATRVIAAGEWFELSGYLGLGFEGTPTAIGLKVYGPPSTVNLCVADVKLEPLSVE